MVNYMASVAEAGLGWRHCRESSIPDFIDLAEVLLQTPGLLDVNSPSFRKQMQEKGCSVGQLEALGVTARTAIVEKDGLAIRQVPSLDNEHFPPIGALQYGESISWIAEILVTNPDRSKELFGLFGYPFEPGYVLLWRQNPDGSITKFVQSEVIPQVLPDGSIDYGNRIIGPSTYDQNYSK